MAKQFKPETLCVQAGWTPKKGEPRVLPIYQSTTFKYDTSEQMARLFDLEDSGYFYTRLQNPTNDAVAAKIAALEGGVAAMLTSSGQAANFYAIFNICQAGDHFVCSSAIYGGTFNLFGVTMKKLGIDVTFVNPDASEEEISAAFKPNTKALFGETISNPSLEVLDIEKFARIAHSHGVPLIVDNTFPTPINCRPFEWGADIVVHSTTKYMDGHATSVGGCIVDSGNFDWDAHAEKFPGLCTPDESYHGLTYTKAFGKGAYITKATAQLMRDLGSIQSPQNSFLLNLGLETLHLRMPQHCRNAQKVAEYLSKNEKVAWVNYCGLPDNKYYSLAQKYMPNGSCGVISFGLKGGRDVYLVFEPMAAAIGIGIDVEAPEGNMIVDIGGGSTEIAVISLGGIVSNNSIRIAGDDLTADIQEYMSRQHNVKVSERMAERIKINVGAALTELGEDAPEDYIVHGPNRITALPMEVPVCYQEVAHCLEKSISKIETAILSALENTPPELYADIVHNGIYLAGGGALLRGLDKRLTDKINIPFHIAEDPLHAVAKGTGVALKNVDRFSFLMR